MATTIFVGMVIVGFGFVVIESNSEAQPSCHSDAILQFLTALEKDGGQSVARCPPGSGFLPRFCWTNSTEELKNNNNINATTDDDEVVGICFACGFDGRTYSTPEGVCRTCSSCTGGAQLRRNCNSTHDTWCECGKDHFRDEVHGKCRVCDPCPHGWGAAIPCTGNSNTVCSKCPIGTYSGVVSSTQDCIVCSSCRNDLVPLHECTPIQDTVCSDDKDSIRFLRKPIAPKTTAEEVLGFVQQDGDDPKLFPLYCALLVAVVLGLVAYVVIKQWQQRRAHKVHQDSNLVASTSDFASSRTSRPLYDCQTSSKKSQVVVCVACSTAVTWQSNLVTAEMKVREMPSAKRREVEALLNLRRPDQKDWRGLARELGYSSSSVAYFEQKGKGKYGPTRHLLGDWSRLEGATVKVLVNTLRRIGRHDAVATVYSTGDGKLMEYVGELV